MWNEDINGNRLNCGVSDNYRMCFMWLSSVRSNEISHHIALHDTDTSAPIPISFGSNRYWRLTIYSVYLESHWMVFVEVLKLLTHQETSMLNTNLSGTNTSRTKLLLFALHAISLHACAVYMHFIRRYSFHFTLFPFLFF